MRVALIDNDVEFRLRGGRVYFYEFFLKIIF